MDAITPENAECGIRHRFDVVFRDRIANAYPRQMADLLRWCQIFDDEGLAPVEGGASAGNLSFRVPSGFVITPSRSRLKSGMSWRDLVEVVRADWRGFALQVLGPRVPSSDSFLHERIYETRRDVQAVFHGHEPLVLRHAEQLAREFPLVLTAAARTFGTVADARETGEELGAAPYLIRTGHGFVAVGRTLDEAGEWSLRVHRRARELG